MKQYNKLVKKILRKGSLKLNERTNTYSKSIFGYQMRFDLSKGFPLLTTKYTNYKSIIKELLWFISGSTNINDLDSNIWNEWADVKGNLGKIYGYQWNYKNQLNNIIKQIKTNPNSRRLIVDSWNVDDLPLELVSAENNVRLGRMALAPCHTLFQFYVNDNKLSLQLYQRSADVMLGLPFNIASYSILLSLVAKVTNLIPSELIMTLGDAHIYQEHIDSPNIDILLERKSFDLPTLIIESDKPNIKDYSYSDFKIINYKYHSKLKFNVVV